MILEEFTRPRPTSLTKDGWRSALLVLNKYVKCYPQETHCTEQELEEIIKKLQEVDLFGEPENIYDALSELIITEICFDDDESEFYQTKEEREKFEEWVEETQQSYSVDVAFWTMVEVFLMGILL